jgi:hypothetical protein
MNYLRWRISYASSISAGKSKVRLARPDFAADGALFALIEELLGEEKQRPLDLQAGRYVR